MNVLVSISSLVLVVLSSHFCNGSYARSPSSYPRYMSGPANNNGKFAIGPRQSSSINFGTNQPSFFQTAAAPSVSASNASPSFLPGYRPFSIPPTPASPYSGYRSPSPATNSYFPYSPQTSATNYRPWSIPPSVSPSAFQHTLLNNAATSINGAAPTSNKYGSSVSANSQPQQHQIIYTSTVKPPTYSVSFSTSARFGAGTRLGATNHGNSSDSTFRGSTTPGKTAGDIKYSYWYGDYGTSGGGVGGQPRGLVQPLPSNPSPPPSSFIGGGGQGNENVPASKFNPQFDTVWGTGPWEGKVHQQTISQSQTSYESIDAPRLKFSTESSHSSSYSPPATKTQEETGKTKSYYSKATPTNPSSKNSQPNSFGVSSYNANIPSNSSKESFGVSSISSWNTQPYEKKKGGYGQQSSGENQQRNSFNEFERDNEIEDDEALNPPTEMDKPIRVKKGSFTWKGGDGKLYEVRYTADSLGMHLEERSEDVLKSIPSPIRIVTSEEEFLKELKSLESESENEVEFPEEELEISSSDRDASFLDNGITDPSNKYNSPFPPDLSTLSEKEIHELYRLYDTLKNSNDLRNHRRGDISFPSFSSRNNERSSPSKIETPEIVISFGTGTSSTSTTFIPLSSNYEINNDRKSTSFPDRNSYYVDPNPTHATHDYIVSSTQSPNSQNSPPKKISYAIRHHSYTKSHSSSDNPNQVPYEQKQEQPIPVISYNRKQYKRSHSRPGTTAVTIPETPIPSLAPSDKINQNSKKKENSSRLRLISRPLQLSGNLRSLSKETKIDKDRN